LEGRNITVEFRGTLRPLYRELLTNPPPGVQYRLYDPRYAILARKFSERTGIPGKLARRAYWRLRYNSFLDRTLLHLSNYWDYSPIRMRRKFVADTENVGTFITNWNFKNLALPSIRKQIEDGIKSTYCKKITPLTKAAQQTMEAVLDLSQVRNKIEVVYPAIRTMPTGERKKREQIRILFIGNDFQIKGGREVVEAFSVLRPKYDVELVIVSQEAYSRKLRTQEGVTILPSLSREILLSDWYPNSDIFCLPTYADSFGFVFLEAKAAGLPIVSTNHFHMPEIVQDGESGFLIKSPLSCWKSDFTYNPDWRDMLSHHFPEAVSELVQKLSILIEDTSLRRRLGEVGKQEVENGRFSINTRNKQLGKIYREALES
jgi:glycosyltransferase involved in cell wall biosynthesis